VMKPKPYALSRRRNSDLEFGSLPRLAIGSMIFFCNAGQWLWARDPGSPVLMGIDNQHCSIVHR
jgi:hypothetical protein